MPRKRYIKPGFFKNDELAKLKPLVRIFFQGLWCWADREGRLENRPIKLKAEIMPYDKINVVTALEQLQSAGFVQLYTSTVTHREVNCIQIINFKKHQHVHMDEAQSLLPESQSLTTKEHRVNTVEASLEYGAKTSFNLELNTYTLNSLEEVVVESAEKNKKSEKQEEFEGYLDEIDQNRNASFPERAFIPEKEKSSAQKEKVFPTIEEAKYKVAETAHWRNVIKHLLKPDGEKDLTPELITELETERDRQFIIFYEQKEDNYKIRYPTYKDMAENFYNWVSSRQRMNLLKSSLGVTKNDNTITKAGAANFRKRTEDTRAELASLNAKSSEFLRKSAGSDY